MQATKAEIQKVFPGKWSIWEMSYNNPFIAHLIIREVAVLSVIVHTTTGPEMTIEFCVYKQ